MGDRVGGGGGGVGGGGGGGTEVVRSGWHVCVATVVDVMATVAQ